MTPSEPSTPMAVRAPQRLPGTASPPSGRPLVIAANRLPVMREGDGEWTPSPGGLVRALLPMLRQTGGTWVGWSGSADDAAEPFELDGVHLHPVALTSDDYHDYYEGFSNDTLWPLYHDAARDPAFKAEQWGAYVRVNERFADALADVAPQDAHVWVHDYHLQLVPAMLRERRDDVAIGFFLHIPFPPLELFTRLPWRDEIARGLLGADLVGFQRVIGASNFASIAARLFGDDVSVTRHGAGSHITDRSGHTARADVFPISIDVEEFENIAAKSATRRAASTLRSRLGDPETVLLGVDRLDYTKGIGQRIEAFGQLLDDGLLDADSTVMIQVATPTREDVTAYREERLQIERLVGAINGRHGQVGHPVLHYLYRSLDLEDLVALYLVGDVMVVTPLRDGMNLVAKEYVASRRDNNGVLVLSEFAGASDQLTEAVLVNPHDPAAMRTSILAAIEMHHPERTRRMVALREKIRHSDVRRWAERFLCELDERRGDDSAG